MFKCKTAFKIRCVLAWAPVSVLCVFSEGKYYAKQDISEETQRSQEGQGNSDTKGENTSVERQDQTSCVAPCLPYNIKTASACQPCPSVNQLDSHCQGQRCYIHVDKAEMMPRKSLHNKELSAAQAERV